MPLDTNFAVVTVILGGLLIWSMTSKVEEPMDLDEDVDPFEPFKSSKTRDQHAAEIIAYSPPKLEKTNYSVKISECKDVISRVQVFKKKFQDAFQETIL